MDKKILKETQKDFQVVCIDTLKTYDSIMVMERKIQKENVEGMDLKQWKNIMRAILSLMLSTDADDAFLDQPEKMKEYDEMLLKYLNMKPPSHT